MTSEEIAKLVDSHSAEFERLSKKMKKDTKLAKLELDSAREELKDAKLEHERALAEYQQCLSRSTALDTIECLRKDAAGKENKKLVNKQTNKEV